MIPRSSSGRIRPDFPCLDWQKNAEPRVDFGWWQRARERERELDPFSRQGIFKNKTLWLSCIIGFTILFKLQWFDVENGHCLNDLNLPRTQHLSAAIEQRQAALPSLPRTSHEAKRRSGGGIPLLDAMSSGHVQSCLTFPGYLMRCSVVADLGPGMMRIYDQVVWKAGLKSPSRLD